MVLNVHEVCGVTFSAPPLAVGLGRRYLIGEPPPVS